jgi:hypothetical protein
LWVLTVSAFIFITAGVFFAITGDWEYLLTFGYWVTTASTTFLALFLRALWQSKGELIGMTSIPEIKEKEEAKAGKIKEVTDKNLVGELDTFCKKETADNKVTAYKNKCDHKVQILTPRKLKYRRKYRLAKWKVRQHNMVEYIAGRKSNINMDNIRISHYKITIDDVLSVSNSPYDKNKKRRYSKGKNLKNSYQTNILTLFASATVTGMNVIVGNFNKEDILLWISQILIFLVNIYSGYNLGLRGILVDYSSDLSDDFVLLNRFLKENE